MSTFDLNEFKQRVSVYDSEQLRAIKMAIVNTIESDDSDKTRWMIEVPLQFNFSALLRTEGLKLIDIRSGKPGETIEVVFGL